MKGSFMMKLPDHVAFALEPATIDLLAEITPLLASHWQEVAHFPDIMLNPDVEFYLNAQAAGTLRVYTLRVAGSLQGYAVFFVRRNPHYTSSIQASQDVLYVDPTLRGTLPLRFLRFCDSQLAAEHVQAIYHHVKAAHNFGLILQRQGYELVDLIYARRLDKET